jgi:chromosomal replication initiator protein
MNMIDKTWEKTLAEIELEISKPNYNTWFKKTFAHDKKDSIFYIGVPNEFNKEWLQTKFNDMILSIIRKHDKEIKSIEYIVKKNKTKDLKNLLSNRKESIQKETLPLQKNTINNNNNLNKKYTFDSFVVGSFNELAYSAAQAIIKKPGVYNPLFIY